jgi:hypothetical protein
LKNRTASRTPSIKEDRHCDFRTVRVDDPDLVRELEKQGVKFTGVQPGFMSEFLWAWILPIGVIGALWVLSRKMKGMGQSVLSFGASHAKLVADEDTKVTFNDVAGCEEAKYELQEVVTFLKHPERYRALGAEAKSLFVGSAPIAPSSPDHRTASTWSLSTPSIGRRSSRCALSRLEKLCIQRGRLLGPFDVPCQRRLYSRHHQAGPSS